MSQVWLLPLLVFSATFALAIPIGLTMAKVFDARLGVPKWLRSIEACLDTGPQNWRQYALSFMAFNAVTFLVGFVVLAMAAHSRLTPLVSPGFPG